MNKKVIFMHKDGTIGGAYININTSNNRDNINIYTYNLDGVETGRARINRIHNNEYYIFDIYCYSVFRGNGIGTMILKIIEAIIPSNVYLRGVFSPYQDRADTSKGRIIEYDKLFSSVRDFYEMNGYIFYKTKGIIKLEKHITFKENNFRLYDDILFDTNLCDYNINNYDKLIKRLSKR